MAGIRADRAVGQEEADIAAVAVVRTAAVEVTSINTNNEYS
jgi:hypothetical protein